MGEIFNHPAIQQVSVSELQPSPSNARTHSNAQLQKLARAIRRFGFVNPIVVDADNVVRAGHGRLEAARICGLKTVPVIVADHMSTADLRAFALADNRIAEEAGWDREILAAELQELQVLLPDLDLTLTGFEIAEIDLAIEEARDEGPKDDLTEQDVCDVRVAQLGDLWVLNDHRILCGDALAQETYQSLLKTDLADAVFADAPYNVKISGNVSGKGRIQHREFAMATGEMSDGEFADFLRTVAVRLATFSKAGSIHFYCMDWRHTQALLEAGSEFYELKNICVWVKDNGGMGSFYRSQHELVVVFKKGGASHRNNVQLGRFGRNRTNVWSYPGVNSFSRAGDEGNLLALHPTVKPVQLIADAILDCTARGELVLDCFLGSGSTLIAAERTGRRCSGIEIDPIYVDVAIRRWQRHTGGQAVHAASGELFDDLAGKEQTDASKK